MTTCTLAPKTAMMHIVTVVTIYATPSGRVHLLSRTGVARNTRKLLVCSINYESRFLMMIEIPDTPVARVVACIARAPQTSFVGIILTMATRTCLRRVLEARRLVTVTTGYFQVATGQRKAGHRMVKARRFPTLFGMTAFAPVALLALVYVVLHVAGRAVLAEFLSERFVRVTTLAACLCVPAEKRITRLRGMIEPRC